MLQVSEQYKNSMKSTLRGSSKLEIKVVNENKAELSDFSSTLNYYDNSAIYKLLYVIDNDNTSYWTGDHNQYVIGDNLKLKQDEDEEFFGRGYVSDASPVIAGVDSNYSITIHTNEWDFGQITLELSTPLMINGFYSQSDISHNYVTNRYHVKMYDGDNLVFDTDVVKDYPLDTPIRITSILLSPIEDYDKYAPFERVRMERFCLGREFNFNNNNIINAEWKEEVDPISRRLPIQTLKFSAIDYEGEFDAIKPLSSYDYVDSGYSVFLKYGYDVNDQSTEWFAPQRYVLESKPSFSNGIVTFNCVKYGNEYSDYTYEYFDGVRSSFEKFSEILGDIPYGYVDESYMSNINIYVPFKNSTKLIDNLQNIAHATGCAMKFDKDGYVTLTPYSKWFKPCDFQLDRSTVVKDSEVLTINPELRNMYINLYECKMDIISRRVELKVVEGDDCIVDFTLPMSQDSRDYSVLDDTMCKGFGCYNELYYPTVTGNAYIEGYPLNISNSKRKFKAGDKGEDETVDNYLISDPSYIRFLADSVYIPFMKSRKVIKLAYRGNPELECGDTFTYIDKYGYKHNVVLLSNTISFNGAIRGTMIVKEI